MVKYFFFLLKRGVIDKNSITKTQSETKSHKTLKAFKLKRGPFKKKKWKTGPYFAPATHSLRALQSSCN